MLLSTIPTTCILQSLKKMVMQETLKMQKSLGEVNISSSQVALIVDQFLYANNSLQNIHI